MNVNLRPQFSQPKKKQHKKLVQKPWFVPVVLVTFLAVLLFLVRNKDSIFKNDNPYNMRYISFQQMEESITKKIGPRKEKTFMIIFGSRNCGACKNFYKILGDYNKKLEKGFKNGYVPNYTTDVAKDKDAAIKFGDKFILDNKSRSFLSKNESLIKELTTPTTFFVVNSKLRRIIRGTPISQLQLINYVKEEYQNK